MERTVEQKLSALLKLQTIDSKLDEIKKIRGDLPEEVQDLEDDIAGLETRIHKFEQEIKNFNEEIDGKKQRKKDAEKLIQKYKDQQMNVRNNREYEALTKEIESEELEIQLCDKKIRESQDKIGRKNDEIEETQKVLDIRRRDLDNKKSELGVIMQESEEDEAKLLKDREKQTKQIEERLLRSYEKIRDNAVNGLAVVMVKRDACGGCFNVVPPQRQAEIREKKKLIICEHCGRIFAGVEDINIVVDDKNKLKGKKTGLKKDETETVSSLDLE
jgi:predicted  nucleic acid-binding Zn-ribbon protein